MTRCYNPNFRQFKDWGGRGIILCDRWLNPQFFIEDIESTIGPRPPGMSLDRIENDGNYEPGNVRWATRTEQARNSRKHPDSRRAHPLYSPWWRLMRRCPNEVLPEWSDFWVFAHDVERLIGPRPGSLRFDRVDDNRPYEPGNIAWITGTEQIKRAQAARWKR